MWVRCMAELVWQALDQDHEAAVNLLESMLAIDPKTRITAQKALDSPFFDAVRGR